MTSVRTKPVKQATCGICGDSFDPRSKSTGYVNRCASCDGADVEIYQGLTVYANKHDRFLTLGKGADIQHKIKQNSRRNFGVISSMVERKS